MSTIRFKKFNRFGRAIGSIDTQMDYGVQATLVQFGFAEFVNPEPAPVPDEADSEGNSSENHRGRKRRYHKETVE